MLISTEQYRQRFANRAALRTACATTLALIIVLAAPHHPVNWFGWFASFSVVIVTVKFPYDNQNHKLLVERFISMAFSVTLCLITFYFFKNSLILFCTALFVYSLWCMYGVGNHHKYHYALFSSMIFCGLSVGLLFIDRSIVTAMWQFPVSILVALMSVVVIDFALKPNVAKQVIKSMLHDWQQNIENLDIELTLPLDNLSYLNILLNNAKSQHSASEFQYCNNRIYLFRMLTLKHNLVVQCYLNISCQQTKDRIKHLYELICQSILSGDLHSKATECCLLTEYLFYCRQNTEQSAWLCLNECQLMLEDIKSLDRNEPTINTTYQAPNATVVSTKAEFSLHAYKFGLRTVVAVSVSLALVFWLNLPGGIQTIIATIVIAGAPNIGASIQKMTMRALGIAIGTLVGFVVLLILSSTQSIIVYLVSTFLFIFFCARWSITSKVYSYAGIQAALLFIIMLSNTGMQSINLTLSTERLYGVFIGGAIAFIVVFLLVPSRPRDLLNDNINKVLTTLNTAWLLLQSTSVDLIHLRDTFVDIDKTLTLCNQSLFEQRFLMTDLPAQQSELHRLQLINDLLKLINRVLISNPTQRASLSALLKKMNVDFLKPGRPISFPAETFHHDCLNAKLQYCLKEIQKNWAAVKLPHVLIK